MAKFIVRVVLHGVEEEGSKYTKLHEEMKKAFYHRTYVGSNNKTYKLPPATYRCEVDWTVHQVRDEVREIASKIQQKNSVFVVDYVNYASIGLDEV